MAKAFGSYWTVTKGVVFILVAIGSSGISLRTWADSSKVTDISDLKDFRGSVYCSDGLAQNPPVKGRSHQWPSELFEKVKNETDQNSQMNQIKAEYCNGSVPRAPISEKIRLIVPKIPPGLALDVASEITKNYIKVARARVKNLFWELSSLPTSELEVSPSCKDSNALSYITLLPLTGSEDIEARYKREPFDSEQVEEISASVKNITEGSVENQPSILVATTVGEHSVIHLLPNLVANFSVTTKIDEMTGQILRSFDEESMRNYKLKHVSGFFVVPQTIGIEGRSIVGTKKIDKYPVLRRAQHMESSMIRNYFVLLMSKESQKEAFFSPSKLDLDLGSNQSPHYFGLDDQGEVKPSKLLEDRDEQWRAYFAKFTSVKEASGVDPNVIDFEVELNTAVFCQYGKSTTQFLSR